MCELFGVTSNNKITIRKNFTSFSMRGGLNGPHKDGWGITFYDCKCACQTFRDTEPCCCSDLSTFVQEKKIKSSLVIAHIRQANSGSVDMQNTHPFSRVLWGKCWNYAHNGQFKDHKKLDYGDFKPLGDTDSEYGFCWILNEISKEFPEKPTDMKPVFDFIAKKAIELNDRGVFNMLISDGEYLMSFCGNNLHTLKREYPFKKVKMKESDLIVDLSKEYEKEDVVTLIATQPLTNEQWKKMEKNTYKIFKNGIEVK